MKTVERVVRVMTHVNIAAGLGMTVWLLWSDYQVVSGGWEPASPRPTSPSPAADDVQPVTLPCCFIEAPAGQAMPVEAMALDAVRVAAAGKTSP